MRRLRSVYIIVPLIILVFLSGTAPAHAADWGDIFGGGAGAAIVGGIACGVLGWFTFGGSCLVAGAIGAIAGVFGGFDWVGDVFGGLVAGLVRAAVSIINLIIIAIGGVLFWVANGLTQVALEINSSIQDSSIVKEGFGIVLNVANLGLVVAIVVTAFMVMQRRAQANQLLVRFIAVALLINFSFFIVTNFLIKPTNEITDILRGAANFNHNSFASTFAPGGFDIGKLFEGFFDAPAATVGQAGTAAIDSAPPWGVEIAVSLLSVVFLVSFIAIGVLVLFSFAAMFFIRYVALSFLIIVMPIALLAWMFPKLKIPGGNPWGLWVAAFTRWLLFAPIGMFFFFLAIRATTAQDVLDLTNPESDTLVGGFEQFGTAIANMMIVIGLLLGGLIVANKMSITGSGWAIAAVKKTGGKIKGWTKARAKLYGLQAVTAPVRSEAGKERVARMQEQGGMRGLTGRLLNTVGARGEQALARDARSRIKTLSESPERLAQATPTLRGARLVEALDTLRKKNALHLVPGLREVMENPSTRAAFRALGRSDDYENVQRAIPSDETVARAAREFEETGTPEALQRLEEAVDALQQSLFQTSKHLDAMNTRIYRPGDQFGFDNRTRQIIAERLTMGILDRIPEATGRLRTKASAAEFANFQSIFDRHMGRFEEANLPENIRGERAETKVKLQYIAENIPNFRDWARRAYPAYNRSMTGIAFAPPIQTPAATPAEPAT